MSVGLAGTYARSLDDAELAALRDRCRSLLLDPPFMLTIAAWSARARA